MTKSHILPTAIATIIGISKDSVASHDKFVQKYGLKFPLASDEDGKVCEKYGTWVEKSMYGRKYMGIDRSTFVIDADGIKAAMFVDALDSLLGDLHA